MIAASHWNREGWHSLFGKQSQRWRGKRKALVETLTMRPAETPAQTPSQPNAQIDFPPKPVLLIHLWSEWVSRPIVEFVRALANETEELVAKLGIFIGKTLYEQGQRRFELSDISQTTPCRQFIAIGQHAHLVFLLHLPLTLTWVGGAKLYLAPLQASQWPYPFRFV
jgi:hypothetical protein